MEIFNEIIAQHGLELILATLLIFSLAGIAMLLLKNRKEHHIIIDETYNEKRKKSDIIIDRNNTADIKNKKDGYETKNYRGTDIETAAWEDATFEKNSGKMKESAANVLDDIKPQAEAPTVDLEQLARFKEIDSKINGVKRSLMNEIITELKENKVQGIHSALESDSFKHKVAERKEREEQKQSKSGGRVA
jgi:hypothetical protein